MQIEYAPKFNFHNQPSLIVRSPIFREEDGFLRLYLSKWQADRLRKHFCGVSECRCNSAGLEQDNEDGTRFSITVKRA